MSLDPLNFQPPSLQTSRLHTLRQDSPLWRAHGDTDLLELSCAAPGVLRLRLAAEGLFGEDHKRRLPVLPAVVGVVTSAQGAVLQDIKTTILRRFPRPILVWPVPVQGDGAAARIAAAIAGFDRIQPGGADLDLAFFRDAVLDHIRKSSAAGIDERTALDHQHAAQTQAQARLPAHAGQPEQPTDASSITPP